ncbi:MAG: hypothetical protein H6573_19420 [Lewinellaceae bacterium]|nr:hypothetical protein [Lewinellaceae bacterium]
MIRSQGKRERLLIESEYLRKKESLVENNEIKELIHKEHSAINVQIRQLETQLRSFGLPLFEKQVAVIFEEVHKELNAIDSPVQLLEWIKARVPSECQQQIRKAYQNNQNISSRIAGKWVGQFISEGNHYDSGEFCIGICQVGNKVFGYGSFLNSLYTKVYLKGLADEDEITIEVLSENVRMRSFFSGHIEEEAGKVKISGNYRVENGFDQGRIESIVEKGVSTLSNKGEKLVLFAELKKMIASGDSQEISQVLAKLEEPNYENEIIIQSKRINSLYQRERMGILSYSEFQLEETKIVHDVLNMISDIESNY